MDWLRDVVGLDARTALDLGAGTGKNLPNLRATGARLIAVEPLAAMRALLAERYAHVDVLDGTAEHIPLADAVVDAVVCAQFPTRPWPWLFARRPDPTALAPFLKT